MKKKATKKNEIVNVNKLKNDIEKEIQEENNQNVKEMVKEKIRMIKDNERKIKEIKERNKEIEQEVEDILSGKRVVHEDDLINFLAYRERYRVARIWYMREGEYES